MAGSKKGPRPRTTCPVALDGEHRWVAPLRAYAPEQLSLGFQQCNACGSVLWLASGHIDRSLNAVEDRDR
jgi:hypothetical protein